MAARAPHPLTAPPVGFGHPSTSCRKQASRVEAVGINFNEFQFLKLLSRHGQESIATSHTLDEQVRRSDGSNSTYVCRKKAQ